MDSRSSGCWSKNCGWLRRKRAISSAFIAFSYLDRSLEDGLRGALHPHRIVAAGPRDGQRSAARRHLHRRIEQAAQDARHGRRARPRAAGQRLARALEPRHDGTSERLDADLALGSKAFLVHELHEAARTVAALLDLAAVGVEDAVAEVGAGVARLVDNEDLVATDSQMSIRDLFQLLFIEIECRLGGIQDHEIVAGTLHLGKRKLHADCRTQAQMRSMLSSSSSGWMGSESTLFAAASAPGSVRPRFDGSYAGWRCKGSG